MYPVCQFAYFSAEPIMQVAVGRAASFASLAGFELTCLVSGHSLGWVPSDDEWSKRYVCFALFGFLIKINHECFPPSPPPCPHPRQMATKKESLWDLICKELAARKEEENICHSP